MDDSFESLQKTNEAPTPATIAAIKDMLVEPSRKLQENEAEVARLFALMQDLRREQADLRQFIRPYDTILAPIRRVPADVLGEIFYHCLPTNRYPAMNSSEAPLLLTHVSKDWRAIALSLAPLWAKIYIPLPILTVQPLGYPGGQNDLDSQAEFSQITINASQARLELFKIWLARSRECPLSLSVYTHDRAAILLTNPQFHPARTILELIVENAFRWKEFQMVVSDQICLQIYQLLLAASVPSPNGLECLTSFRFHSYGPREHMGRIIQARETPYDAKLLLHVLERTTNLKTLSVFTSWRVGSHIFLPNVFRNLSHIDLQSGVHENHLAELFRRCENVVECKLYITRGPSSNPLVPAPDPLIQLPTIHLPHLQTLVILDDGLESSTAPVFRAIEAPKLRSLEYTKPPPLEAHRARAENATPAILALLEQASLLEYFKLGYQSLSSISLHKCIETARNTRHLVLGKRARNIYPENPRFEPKIEEPVDLRMLNVQHQSSAADTEIQLPYLEHLEAHQILTFGDDDLLEMIKSRFEASKTGQVSPLKSVKMTFIRQQEKDIREQALECAREVGVDLELKLEYEEPKQIAKGYSIVLSSKYGLPESKSLADLGLPLNPSRLSWQQIQDRVNSLMAPMP